MYTVMLVDNDTEALAAMAARLCALECEVVVARDGFRALELLRTTPVDLVITELRIPGLDGHHICFEIKLDPMTREIPVLVVTRETDPIQHEKVRQLGADGVVVKRPGWGEMVRQVRRLLGTTVGAAA